MGGSKLSTASGKRYTSWLSTLHAKSRGKSDLVAHFFRRAFGFLRDDGTFGLIATNTIRQGDTRETGLYWIRKNGGTIYSAETRRPWPGTAAVVVSVVHVMRSRAPHPHPVLNGQPVDVITAYLFHMGPDGNTSTLRSNRALVHSGTNINGKGFVLTKRTSRPIHIPMSKLLRAHPALLRGRGDERKPRRCPHPLRDLHGGAQREGS